MKKAGEGVKSKMFAIESGDAERIAWEVYWILEEINCILKIPAEFVDFGPVRFIFFQVNYWGIWQIFHMVSEISQTLTFNFGKVLCGCVDLTNKIISMGKFFQYMLLQSFNVPCLLNISTIASFEDWPCKGSFEYKSEHQTS